MGINKRKKYKVFDIDLITELLNDGFTITEIEVEFGYGDGTIRKYLNRAYIKKVIYVRKSNDKKTKCSKQRLEVKDLFGV